MNVAEIPAKKMGKEQVPFAWTEAAPIRTPIILAARLCFQVPRVLFYVKSYNEGQTCRIVLVN